MSEGSMSLPVAPLKRLFSVILLAQGKNGLLLQRLFWGALLGCLSTFLLAGSPYLNNLESNMLEWRYMVADKISSMTHGEKTSAQISLVNFDDNTQFELGVARFNDLPSQQVLAEAIEHIEKCEPAMVVLDLDLRGTTCPALVKLFQRYHNIVLALFGNLEGNIDLPSPAYLTNTAAFGYDELPDDSSGLARQLSVTYQALAPNTSASAGNPLVPVPSLTEAVINLNRLMRGTGPDIQLLMNGAASSLYFSFRKMTYSARSFLEVLHGDIGAEEFKNKIVIMGSTPTPRHLGTSKENTLTYPRLKVHADAISTLLDNEQIYPFSPQLSQIFIMFLGIVFGATASILNFGRRSLVFITCAICLFVLAQVSFQLFHLLIPIAPPLAVLILCFILATFIHLDTDLRIRNRELAQARESMQIRAEAERQRIAEDLHDETLPTLSAVARMADQLNKELGNNPIPAQMRERLDFTASEMRRVINDLHPSVLETMGFKPALDNLLTILARNSVIETHFTSDDNFADEDISKFCQLQLYRIVQECLNNVHKHAKATVVTINIAQRGNKLILSVVDNGVGMPAGILNNQSHGVLNIKQRAQLIAARADWKRPSQYSSGTEVRIEMSFNNNKEMK